MDRYVDEFWDSADGDNFAPAIMRAQIAVPLYTPLTLVFSNKAYRCDETIDIVRPRVLFRSDGPTTAFGTTAAMSPPGFGVPTLYWWDDSSPVGIVVHYPGTYQGGSYGSLSVDPDATARGDNFELDGVALQGPGLNQGWHGEILGHGINAHMPISVRRTFIVGFRGHGIKINASTGSTTNLGGANFSQLGPNVRVYNCGMSASLIAGGDANQIRCVGVNVNDAGEDMNNREFDATTVLAGRQCSSVQVITATSGLDYDITIASKLCRFHSTTSAMQDIVTGLIYAINSNSTVNGTVTALQIAPNTLMVYADSNDPFTINVLGSAGPLGTPLQIAANSASPTQVVVLSAAQSVLDVNDVCTCMVASGGWTGGWGRGVVRECGQRYGYMLVDLGQDKTNGSGTLSNPTGSTWRMTMSNRHQAMREYIGRQITIRGSDKSSANAQDEPNNGTFTTTLVRAGVYHLSTVDFLIYQVLNSHTYRLVINGTEVTYTSDSSAKIAEIRDGMITAINASGLHPTITASANGNRVRINRTSGSDVFVEYNVNWTAASGTSNTWIEWTNASGIADTTTLLWSMPQTRQVPQGLYSGSFRVWGRQVQIIDSPLIGGYYQGCSVNGPGSGDGWFVHGGYSQFLYCYTEGSLQCYMAPPSTIIGGTMNFLEDVIGFDVTNYLAMRPSVQASALDPGVDGSVIGRIGGGDNSAFEWTQNGGAEDVFRMQYRQTQYGGSGALGGTGDSSWEVIIQNTNSNVIYRLGDSRNQRMGVGGFEISQPGLFIGSMITKSSEDAVRRGYLGWVQHGSLNAFVDCIAVLRPSNATAATPIVLTTDTNLLPTNARVRALVRNIQGLSGANGLRILDRSGAGSTLKVFTETGGNTTGTGTYTADTGIAICYRLVAFGSAPPTSGNWVAGDLCYNTNQSASKVVGWRCVVGGSPGTWVTLDAPAIVEIASGTATYTVGNDEEVVISNRSARGALMLTLPTVANHRGKRVTIKDKGNNAATNIITIKTSGGDTIDGAGSATISTNRGVLRLVGTGNEWSVM